jgi:flagella basal body P-ring formation protein FlgA
VLAVAPVRSARSATAVDAAARRDVERAVAAAIVSAVAARVGDGVSIEVSDVRVLGTVPVDGVVAVPETTARAGRAAVFSLSADRGASRRRIGSAVATVRLAGPSLRAGRPLSRGEAIGDADLVEVDGDLAGVPLRALPGRAALVGAKAARDVAAGEPLTDAAVRTVPLVESGDEVVVKARVGGVEARGRAIASQDGGAGAVIQIVNPETRRLLKARVTGRGEVEVIP